MQIKPHFEDQKLPADYYIVIGMLCGAVLSMVLVADLFSDINGVFNIQSRLVLNIFHTYQIFYFNYYLKNNVVTCDT